MFFWVFFHYAAVFNALIAFMLCVVFSELGIQKPILFRMTWLWVALMSILFVVQITAPVSWRHFLNQWFYFPFSVAMFWNLVIVLLALFLMTPMLCLLFLRKRFFKKTKSDGAALVLQSGGITRRNFIYLASAGAAPALALGAGVHGTLTRDELRLRRLIVPVPGLESELEGLTITHLSDLHAGVFCREKKLKIISDLANDLKSDIVVVTGDIVNDSTVELPMAIEAVKRIETRYGTYLCEGNHDRMAGRHSLENFCLTAGLPCLSRAVTRMEIRGCQVALAGLPWVDHHFDREKNIIRQMFTAGLEQQTLKILLAHHPHFLDVTEGLADLVLSGHTHGGQLMFGDVGAGPILFRYWSGLYKRGDTSLVVSNGCGDWFPCRVGAPAEVLHLTLKSA